MLRDHQPVPINAFNGLWRRGDVTNTPLDHFQDCENLRFVGGASVATRYGIGVSQDVSVPLDNVKRIYNYPTQTGNTLLVLTYNYLTDEGNIYHVVDSTTVYGPLLTISNMTDFAFAPFDGRAYISPFSSQRQTLSPPTPPNAALVAGAGVDSGLHKYAVSFVTSLGETIPSDVTSITTLAALANPTQTPLLTDRGGTFGNALTAGETYKWLFTITRNGLETAIGPESAGFVAPIAAHLVGMEKDTPFTDETAVINVYRTVGNGSTFYRESQQAAASNIPLNGSGTYLVVGTVSDAAIIANPTAPVANNTQEQQVNVTGIQSGIAGVTSRKIWRTAAAASQLKLLTTIADNTTTSFLDTVADSGLGANAPTTNTAYTGTLFVDKGLENEFVYVYLGDGVAARKAAGSGMTGTMTVANGAAGHTDPGLHIFGIVSETDTGYLSPPAILTSFSTSAGSSVSFGNIPTSGDPHVVKRHLVSSIIVNSFNGDLEGYDLFFVPDATINNNSDTFLNNISFYDADLLDDASHLFDNYSEIPAGAALSLYHNRLCVFATFNDISIGLISTAGEPEAISQIDGIIVVPLDGNPITNGQELRDVLYVTKASRTVSFTDNGDVPSSWPLVVIDNALGSSVHGIATVLDSGSSSVDFLIIATYQGISLFNGRYITPELSWKIEDYWRSLSRDHFDQIQIINAPIQKEIYCILPNRKVLVGNYANGMDPKAIRWMPYSFKMGVNTIAIANVDEIIFGADLNT